MHKIINTTLHYVLRNRCSNVRNGKTFELIFLGKNSRGSVNYPDAISNSVLDKTVRFDLNTKHCIIPKRIRDELPDQWVLEQFGVKEAEMFINEQIKIHNMQENSGMYVLGTVQIPVRLPVKSSSNIDVKEGDSVMLQLVAKLLDRFLDGEITLTEEQKNKAIDLVLAAAEKETESNPTYANNCDSCKYKYNNTEEVHTSTVNDNNAENKTTEESNDSKVVVNVSTDTQTNTEFEQTEESTEENKTLDEGTNTTVVIDDDSESEGDEGETPEMPEDENSNQETNTNTESGTFFTEEDVLYNTATVCSVGSCIITSISQTCLASEDLTNFGNVIASLTEIHNKCAEDNTLAKCVNEENVKRVCGALRKANKITFSFEPKYATKDLVAKEVAELLNTYLNNLVNNYGDIKERVLKHVTTLSDTE